MRETMYFRAVAITFLILSASSTCRGGANAFDEAMSHYLASSAMAPTPVQASPADINAARGSNWLAMSEQYVTAETTPADGRPAEAATAKRAFVPYAERRGPAYPGDCLTSFGRDAKELLPMVWGDTKAVFTNPCGLVFMGLAIGAGAALHGENGDDDVADHYTRHGHQLNKFWDNVGDVGGNPGFHFAIAGTLYFTGLARGDTKTYEVAKTMLSALSITGLTTVALKGIANTDSPNGDPLGWPSGHTSSSFCMAAVLYESYGPWVGMPAYAFATFVGYERIDARNHDFSDVISGALIGMAIGHLVAQNHKPKIMGMDLVPYTDDRGAFGLALAKSW